MYLKLSKTFIFQFSSFFFLLVKKKIITAVTFKVLNRRKLFPFNNAPETIRWLLKTLVFFTICSFYFLTHTECL